MIVNEYIEKLKQVFATKEDIARIELKIVTKDDLKQELKNYATKDDLRREIQAVAQDTATIIEMLGSVISKLDLTLKGHEQRIQKLEDRVFS